MDTQNRASQNLPQNPIEPLEENKPHSSFFKNKLFLITVVILTVFTLAYAGIYLSLNSKLNQITKPTPSPTPVDETANWKTYNYRIKGLDLTFRYPPTWEKFPQGEGGGVSFHAPDYNELDGTISIEPLLPQASFQMICGNEIKYAREWNWINVKETQTKINLIPATILRGKIGYTDDKIHDRAYAVLMDNKHCVRVDAMSYNNPSQEEIFEQILSTFKFTDQ